MQIEESNNAADHAQENSRQPVDGFEFNMISIADPKVFPSFKDAQNQQLFFKWGLKDSMEVAKFRFNKTFHLVGADEFLKDLFNNKTVL
jgi:hypothetical protein